LLPAADDDLAADEAQQPQRVRQRPAELASFQRRQVRLPDTHGLGRSCLRHPGLGPEVLQRSAQISCGDHEIFVIRYCHTPIIPRYWYTAISLKSDVAGESKGAGYQLGRTLIEHDLVDELRLVVYPVVLGAGERLFGETSDKKPMRLVDTKTIGDGLAFLTYKFVRAA